MTERLIQAESRRRISHIAEYVDQYETGLEGDSLDSALDAVNKILIITEQCKLDVQELKRREKLEAERTDHQFPRYVKLGGIALRFIGNRTYFRDAGLWEVKAKWKDGKLVVSTRKGPMAHAYGAELVECSEDEWFEQNQAYVHDKQIAWGPDESDNA